MFIFVPNKQFSQLITISPHVSIMLKATNAWFQSIQVWFTDHNNRPLEIEVQVNIIKIRYSTEPKYIKYVKKYGFLSFPIKFIDKYSKKLKDTGTKTGIDAAKTASKWVAQKTSDTTGDLIGNKIADKITSKQKVKRKKAQDKKFT